MTTLTTLDNFQLQPQNLITPGLYGLYGPPGSTKSSIACTFPKPLVFYDFDRGLHRARGVKLTVTDNGSQPSTVASYFGVSGLVIPKYPDSPVRSMTTRFAKLDGWTKAWSNFVKSFVDDCENSDIKTIVWDTATVEWKLCTDGFLEELQQKGERKQLLQIEYGEPNSRQNTMLQAAAIYRKNLVLVHHETDEYAPITMGGRAVTDAEGNPKSAPTGRKLPDGFRYTTGKCDWIIHTVIKQQEGLAVPVSTIEKSALGLDILGTEFNWLTYGSLEQALKLMGRV